MSVYAMIWGILIVLSLFWYAFLLFYIGYKGGKEIVEMTKELRDRNAANDGKSVK